MRKGVLVASRGIAWVAVWATVAILLVWLAVPVLIVVRDWREWVEVFEEGICTAPIRAGFFGGLILMFAISHFLPLYCVDVFLWTGMRRALQVEERRWFWMTVCVLGMLVSMGVVAWYAREAVLLEIREFFV